MSTVFVGKTDFPLRPDPSSRGPVPLQAAPSPSSSFCLLDGPPYANGAPHLGHVLNKHLKDTLVRAQATLGHKVQWRPGWDCHGLPVELAVEKQGGRRKDPVDFVNAARAYATEQAQLQSGVFQQQGWCAQWDHPWHTQDFAMEAGTLRVLAQLLEKDALCVRFAALPWCAQCQSTVSNAEQEERDVQLDTWVVPFEFSPSECVLSWTTTPWTLPLHRALVVHPHTHYVALEKEGRKAWVSEATAALWAQRLGACVSTQWCTGAQLQYRAYTTPWAQGSVQVDESVVPEAGTGVLHAVPGLSELDTQLGERHRWGMVHYLLPDGRVQHSPMPEQNGVSAQNTPHALFQAYVGSPWFFRLPHVMKQPHCWRHGTPLLTRATRQVFLELTPQVRARAERMLDEMEFNPPAGRERLRAAMRSREHWCLSRQRTWGVPLALFLDAATQQPHAQAPHFMRQVADEVEKRGVSAWWDTPSSRWLGDVTPEQVERVDDVLDVWFDSGCVPVLQAGDAVVEGTDQHRGWFQSCVWLAAALDAPAPFKRVVTHGFVVDESGSKLSKSKGGDKASFVQPWHALPTDVVRVWALMGADGHDKRWTQETVDAAQSLLTRWRGAVRFMLANAQPLDAAVDLQHLPAWDRYWVHRCQQVSHEVVHLLSQARFGEAVSLLSPFGEAFSSVLLGSWKDRLYCALPTSVERKVLNHALHACLEAWGTMMQALAPRMYQYALPFWPSMESLLPVPLAEESEMQEVERVLRLREELGPQVEELQKMRKGGLGCVAFEGENLPSWPGQVLADAMGLGHAGGSMDHARVCASSFGNVTLGVSALPLCPRCRRCNEFEGSEVCRVCTSRLVA